MKSLRNLRLSGVALLGLSLAGTAGFHFIEGWSWFDGFYMVITTFTTIGYQETHPLSHAGRVFNVGLIVVTTDKGLCGGLNTNVLRLALTSIKAWQAKGIGVQVTAIGNKGLGFMHRIKANVVSQVVNVGDGPQLDKLNGPGKVPLSA